ncbi:AI-2E family transporter [Natrialbaceae archaeon AArc-T1-2]|uniref:AI-2E family transporter n=1 Tax=Natrialbaceae archaeon AArc-T1-2 TaxID=3053904 RepID=UPI00255A9FA6|nr:AI-2E family transporter [Natrialbaceae archaeon AArc-T1-2]WIV66045.1 AI-2E family transporter [Natrialbaceae archaeon AArc-T1-2]
MDVRTGFFALLVALLATLGFLMVAPFLQYVMAAALLAFVLYPTHERLSPTLGPRASAAALTSLAFVAAVVPLLIFSLVIIETAITFLEDLDQSDVDSATDSIRDVLVDGLGIDPDYVDELEAAALEEFEQLVAASTEILLGQVLGLLDTTIHMGLGVMILAFLLYYFLVDGISLLEWIRDVTPLEDAVQTELFEEMSVVTWAVIQSHLLVAIVEGILGGFGLYVVGVSNVAFWTVVMIVVSVMPIVGVWLVWGPAVVYLFATGDVTGGLFLLGYGVAVLSVVDNYLRAIFVDRSSGVHPAVVLVGVVGGIYLLGIMGLFLGPILLAVFKASVVVFSRTQETDGTPA